MKYGDPLSSFISIFEAAVKRLLSKFRGFKILIWFSEVSSRRKRMLAIRQFIPEKFGLCEKLPMPQAD
jgi:hypothetical protein